MQGSALYSPHLPPRSSDTSRTSTSPTRSDSSPRKVVTDFGAFSAPANSTVFGTAVQSSPFSLAGGKAAFGGMRNGGHTSFAEDDDDEEDTSDILGGQRIELREDSITLDQVNRSIISVILGVSNMSLITG